MAGHAPRLSRPANRPFNWFKDLSDLRISVYMLILAAAAIGAVYALDQRLFG